MTEMQIGVLLMVVGVVILCPSSAVWAANSIFGDAVPSKRLRGFLIAGGSLLLLGAFIQGLAYTGR